MPASCTHQQRNDSWKKPVGTAASISEGTGRADCGKNNCDRPSEIRPSMQMSCFPAQRGPEKPSDARYCRCIAVKFTFYPAVFEPPDDRYCIGRAPSNAGLSL